MDITETAKRKVLELIVDTDNCIEYPITNREGYGMIQGFDNNGKKLHMLAHRVAYQLYTGDNIVSGDVICHRCDNSRCINPKHLFKGTHLDNVKDKVSKGRQAKGEKNGRYIDGRSSDRIVHRSINRGNLSLSQVMEVRELKRRGEKLKSIASILNIPYQTVRDISCGRVYKDVK